MGDVSSPSMALGENNTIWVTYSRWNTFYENSRANSKDCEVYAKYFTNDKWSEEFQISPTNMKIIESWDDHYSPKIIDIQNNKVLVSWFCDLHEIYKVNPDLMAYSPSILFTYISNFKDIENPKLFGEVNLQRVEKPIPEYNVDIMLDNKKIIHAIWLQKTNSIIYNSIVNGQKQYPQLISKTSGNYTVPTLIKNKNRDVSAIYGENTINEGKIFLVNLMNTNLEPKLIKSINVNLEFVKGVFNDSGDLVIIFSAFNENSCELQVEKIKNSRLH